MPNAMEPGRICPLSPVEKLLQCHCREWRFTTCPLFGGCPVFSGPPSEVPHNYKSIIGAPLAVNIILKHMCSRHISIGGVIEIQTAITKDCQ